MFALRLQILWCLIVAAGSCASGGSPHDATPIRLFGPVLGRDAIVGRADPAPGQVLLLVRGVGLVFVDLDDQRFTTTALPPELARTCWGLARLPDGSLWTLKDRHTLSRLDSAGGIVQEFELSAPHLGLFAIGDRLIYQIADVGSGRPLAEAGPPGNSGRLAWTAMRQRTFDMTRASVTALNLVACGETRTRERPCWFPDEAAISLIDPAGAVRRVELAGLTHVAPEVLLTADNPPRPIRGAYVDSSGTIWILSSGTPSSGAGAAPGGWLLARYRHDGGLIDIRQLTQPARVILRADGQRAWLLASDGYVIQVVS